MVAASRSAAEAAASGRDGCMMPPNCTAFPGRPRQRFSIHWSRWQWKGSMARQTAGLIVNRCASYAAITRETPTYSFPSAAGQSQSHRFPSAHPAPREAANMPFPIHPHMLRHACGFKLANDGHDTRALQHYLGHKNIQHTVRYTEWRPTASRIFGANWRRQARDRLPLDYLGIRGRIALRNQRLNHLDRALDLLISHRLNAAGRLDS